MNFVIVWEHTDRQTGFQIPPFRFAKGDNKGMWYMVRYTISKESVRISAFQRPILTLELEIAVVTIGLPFSDSDLDSSLCPSEVSAAAHTLRGRLKSEKVIIVN